MKSEKFWNARKRFSHIAGKPLGVPIRIHYSVYLTLLLFAIYGLVKNVDYSNPWPDLLGEGIFLLFLTTIFASILLHELGHSVVASILKRKVTGIIIYPLFGGTVFKHTRSSSPGNDFLIANAGPLMNFAIAGILSHLNSLNFINAIAEVNIWIGCLNLMPLWPLDGGRILKSLLALKGWRHTKINRIMLNSSRLSALGMGLTAFTSRDYLSLIFIAFLLLIAHAEFSKSNDKPSKE